METMRTTDVIICGAGPTGLLLSTLLARSSVSSIVLDKEPEVTQDPRGIALDEDGIRCLQACGIYDKVYTEIGHSKGNLFFVGGKHSDMYRPPFMKMVYTTSEGGTGHPGLVFHVQPRIETHLRAKIAASSFSELLVSSTLTAIREDDDWVYVIYNNAQGEERHLRSKFLVGCDGKTGFTRKKYLEPRGITMDGASKMAYEEVWVALNWQMSLPTPKSHPDFPLWSKGYTPEQVFELFFPIDFRFLCNPERAAVCGRFGLLEDRLWRFEYVLKPGEVGTDMAKPQHVERIVYPYITHPGSRYGLEQRDLRYPTDCIKVLRCRPFKFSARSCNKWALDRVLLCGDSAHVFPPFGGQGIASGFRDAIGVAWRLALATKPLPRDGQTLDFRKLFLGWYSERKQQLDRSLEATVINGNYVTASNPWRIFVRDWSLWLVQLIPSWKRYVEQGVRAGGMTRYRWEADHAMFFLPEMGGGVNMRQAYCRQLLGDGQIGKVQFTDDAIYDAEKTGLFQLVAFLLDIKDLESAKEAVKGIEDVSRDLVNAGDTTFIILSISCQSDRGAEDRVYRLATGEEFVNDGTMCAGRPQPDGYDPYRLTKELGGKRFAILRPDRFVFASCNTKDELQSAASELVRMIG